MGDSVDGRRWVLLPATLEYSVPKEVAKTFDDDKETKIVKLSDVIVTNYGSGKQVSALYEEISNNIMKWSKEYNEGDEVYVIVAGANLPVAITVKILEWLGIEYKFLVYEKKLGRYAIISIDGSVEVQ